MVTVRVDLCEIKYLSADIDFIPTEPGHSSLIDSGAETGGMGGIYPPQ